MNAMRTPAPDRQHWLDARRKGIGGSDVAAILGLSPWQSALDVYLDKIGEAEETPDNDAMRWGRALEPVIGQAYTEATGIAFAPGATVIDPQHPELRANLDGIAADRVIEIKTARTGEGWGEPGTDEIPVHYAAQVMHYLMLTGKALADVAVLIGGSDFRIYTLRSDDDTIAHLRERELAFWHEHVVPRIPPPVTIARDARGMWPLSRSGLPAVQVGIDVVQAVQQIKDAKARIKDAQAEIDAAENVLLPAFGEAEAIADGDTLLATWKTQTAKRLDITALRNAHPSIAAEFTTESTSRVLRLK